MAESNIKRETVDTWDDLRNIIDSYSTKMNQYIFRGHRKNEWKLESSLRRMLSEFYPGKQSDWNVKKHNIYDSFMSNIRGRSNIPFGPLEPNEDEIWALGRHYGLYTPLLDWTRSPYVALFFALWKTTDSGDGFRALWALHVSDIEKINCEHRKKGAAKLVDIINPMTNETSRLVNQNGLFLNIPLNLDLEAWVNEGIDTKEITLNKISFPEKIRNNTIAILNNMNINNLSLFPDLAGASLHSNYQFEIEEKTL